MIYYLNFSIVIMLLKKYICINICIKILKEKYYISVLKYFK